MRNPKSYFCPSSSNFKPTDSMKNVLRQFLIVLSLRHLRFMQKSYQKDCYSFLVTKPRYNIPSSEEINIFLS